MSRQVFDHWETYPEAEFAEGTNAFSENAKIKMPLQNTLVKIVKKTLYSIAATRGTANLSEAEKGTKITLTANAAAYNEAFREWSIKRIDNGQSVTPLNGALLSSQTISFSMPDSDVTATATFEPRYQVTVPGGTASPAWAKKDEIVTITAPASI